ncbi:MAG: PAS domain S-box protein [Gemmatimonadetes bacterium]|nr:PAS domain S-box protein [Gemmatimonadota bacterium]
MASRPSATFRHSGAVVAPALAEAVRRAHFGRVSRIAARAMGAPRAVFCVLVGEAVMTLDGTQVEEVDDLAVVRPRLAALLRMGARAGTPQVVADADRLPELARHAPDAAGPLGSAVLAPFSAQSGAVRGCVAVLDAPGRAYTTEEREALADIAYATATAMALVEEIEIRQSIEASLVDSERRLRDLLDSTTDLVQAVGADGHLRYANRAWRDALGYREEDIPRLTVAELVAVDQRDAFEAALEFANTAGEVRGVSTILRHATGRRVVVTGNLRRRDEESGSPTIEAVFRDVTTQTTIQSERERLIATLEATTDVVAIMDVNGLVSYVNEAGRALLGRHGRAEVVEVPLSLLHPDWAYARIVNEAIPAAIAEGSWSGETAVRDDQGHEYPVSQVIVAHESARGGVWFLSTIMHDISERKRAEEEMRESEQRFRRLSDASRDGIVVVDKVIRDANRAVSRMFQIEEAELIGMPVTQLVLPEQRPSLAGYLTGGLDGTMETVGLRRTGATFDLEIAMRPLSLHGRVARVLVLRDISGPKEVDRLKSEFVSTVSHELRTPLTSIRGALGLVQGGAAGALPPKAAELLGIALGNTDRLTRLVNDLLDLNKIEAGRLELTLSPLSTRDVVADTLRDLGPLATSQQLRLVGDAESAPMMVGDRDRVLQVLANLVSNAIKYSSAGDVIRVRARRAGGHVRVEVEDHGPGIPADQLGRLFQRFQQVGDAASRKPGTGLGLAISRSIVEMHKGRIGVDSHPGVRTIFWFEIPASGAEGA